MESSSWNYFYYFPQNYEDIIIHEHDKTDTFLCQEYIFFCFISVKSLFRNGIKNKIYSLQSLYIVTASFIAMKEAVTSYPYIIAKYNSI